MMIGRHETRRLVEQDHAQLVEVLPASAYSHAHIPGAVSIPLKEFSAEALSGLRPDDPVIVYCNDFL